MSIKNRVSKLEERSNNEFNFVITKGEFYDRSGNPISTENGRPPNLEEDVHRAIVSVSKSDETVTLRREEGETGAEFMRRFDRTGFQIGKRAGANVTLFWDAKWA